MCSVPAPRRCKQRVTANQESAPNAAMAPRERAHDEEPDSIAPFVVYALEVARAASFDESAFEEPGRRRAAG